MKKILLALSLTFAGLTLTSSTLGKITSSSELTCQYGQCQAIAKSTGEQCKHCVSNAGDNYCWQHK